MKVVVVWLVIIALSVYALMAVRLVCKAMEKSPAGDTSEQMVQHYAGERVRIKLDGQTGMVTCVVGGEIYVRTAKRYDVVRFHHYEIERINRVEP